MATRRTFVIVGAGLAGAKAAETLRDGGLRRARRARSAPRPSGRTSGRRCPRDCCSAPPSARIGLRAPGGLVRRARRRPAHRHDRSTRHRPRRAQLSSTTASGCATTSCCSPPGRAPRRSTCRRAICGVRVPAHPRRRRRASPRLATAVPRLVVIGAGWIGLEVAAAARHTGAEVTVVEAAGAAAATRPRRRGGHGVRRPAPRPRRRPSASARVARSRADRPGTRRPGRRHRSSAPTSCWSASASQPNTELAERRRPGRRQRHPGRRALRTDDPDIFAAGDVANVAPSVARHAGSGSSTGPTRSTPDRPPPAPCSAQPVSYDRLPYFFTDQYDLGMEYSGWVAPDRAGSRPGRGARRPGQARVHRVLGRVRAGYWPA